LRWLKSKEAKLVWVCIHSLQLMSLLENMRPGMRPCFLSQKMDAKEPESCPAVRTSCS
ncbi:hypothetical protein EV702DRAFT_964700, partial [Suillus placidus]